MTVYSTPTNITTLNTAMVYVNTTTGGLFGVGVLIAFFMILFFAMRSSMGEYAGVNAKILLASSFATSVVSIFFFTIGIVNDWTMYICITITALSIYANKNSGGL